MGDPGTKCTFLASRGTYVLLRFRDALSSSPFSLAGAVAMSRRLSLVVLALFTAAVAASISPAAPGANVCHPRRRHWTLLIDGCDEGPLERFGTTGKPGNETFPGFLIAGSRQHHCRYAVDQFAHGRDRVDNIPRWPTRRRRAPLGAAQAVCHGCSEVFGLEEQLVQRVPLGQVDRAGEGALRLAEFAERAIRHRGIVVVLPPADTAAASRSVARSDTARRAARSSEEPDLHQVDHGSPTDVLLRTGGGDDQEGVAGRVQRAELSQGRREVGQDAVAAGRLCVRPSAS